MSKKIGIIRLWVRMMGIGAIFGLALVVLTLATTSAQQTNEQPNESRSDPSRRSAAIDRARDEVALREIQRDGRQAELHAAEIRLQIRSRALARLESLADATSEKAKARAMDLKAKMATTVSMKEYAVASVRTAEVDVMNHTAEKEYRDKELQRYKIAFGNNPIDANLLEKQEQYEVAVAKYRTSQTSVLMAKADVLKATARVERVAAEIAEAKVEDNRLIERARDEVEFEKARSEARRAKLREADLLWNRAKQRLAAIERSKSPE